MAKLLFRLNGVPEDEADDIRELLASRQIEFYETHQGRWGISVAAIWLKNEEQLELANRLIEEYQAERASRVRAEYETLKRQGREETLFSRFRDDPLRFLLYAAIILAILYFSLMPYLRSWR